MTSPAKQAFTTPSRRAPQLQWHNTLPEDFSGKTIRRKDETPHGHKRMSSFSELNMTPTKKGSGVGGEMFYQNEFASSMPLNTSPGSLPSPTKRQKGTTAKSSLKTPVKIMNGGALGSVKSMGMATPPPSSTTATRKRGRPPKRKENVPPPAPPTPNSARMMSLLTNAIKAPSSSSASSSQQLGFNQPTQESTRPVTSSADLQKNIFWEGGSDFSGLAMPPPTSGFDWGSLKGTSGGVNDLFSSITSNDGTDRLSSELDINDPIHFSFLGSDDMDGFGMGVDPNRIFSSKDGMMSSIRTDLDLSDQRPQMSFMEQPYQHQMLQQQREAMESKETQKKKVRSSKKLFPSGGKVAGLDNPFEPVRSRPGSTKARSSSPAKSGAGSVFSDATSSSKSALKNPTVIFTISPSGRAKTEVVSSTDCTDSEEHSVATSENSLWQDYLDSDSSFDDDVPRGLGPGGKDYMTIRASRSKFKLGDGSPRSRKKYGTMPTIRPNRRTSVAQALVNVFPESSPRLPSPVRTSPPDYARSSSSRNRRVSCSSFNSQFTSSTGVFTSLSGDQDEESEAETVFNDDSSMSQFSAAASDARSQDGDAMQALKELMASRQTRQKTVSARNTPVKQPSSSGSLFFNGSSTIGRRLRPSDLPSDMTLPGTSPVFNRLFTTPRTRRPRIQLNSYIEPASSPFDSTTVTPTPRRTADTPHDEDGQTRCVCNNTRGGGTTMVQCESCHNWLHLKCIGLNRKTLPQVYVCSFCTGGDDEVDGHRRSSTRGRAKVQQRRRGLMGAFAT